ncbi:MAG: AAA domain-containing protein [Parachlamydiaceae bacterium]
MQPSDSLEHKQAILNYWALVEFFSPYHLENTLDSPKKGQKIYAQDNLNEKLAWLNAPLIEKNNPSTPFAKGYSLYLGLFSTEETADRARHYFAKEQSNCQSLNWRNCGNANSMTCFARLTLTTHGIPLFGTLSLSTLPWAHGRLIKENEKLLSIEKYWKSVNRLIVTLREEFSEILPEKLMKEPNKKGRYLDGKSLFELVHLLYDWAGYQPEGYPIAMIESLDGDRSIEAKDPLIKNGRDVPILNSFYIQDIESAAISLMKHRGQPIDRYLSQHHEGRISLKGEKGAQIIFEMIRPDKIPSGRWPSPPNQQQSLMQQFAINAVFETLESGGIFSVNGPPGTGKTSLLREIIAQNIVARADALSQFKSPKDAFIARQAVNFENHDPIFISELDPSLLGYEMLVASSNNSAIQNLSRELPLRSQIGDLFKKASYLEPIATKMLGLNENDAWGLISATLGNTENCRQFIETIFMLRNEREGESRIWEWVDNYEGASFQQAKKTFIATKKHQENIIGQLDRLAHLHEELHGHTLATYYEKEYQALEKEEKESERIQHELSELFQNESDIKKKFNLMEEREVLLRELRPGKLKRMLKTKAAAEWAKNFEAHLNEKIQTIADLQQIKTAIKELNAKQIEHHALENEIREKTFDRALQFHFFQESYDTLKKAHPKARLPQGAHEVEKMETQIHSFYQTEELNTARSELFIAATTLHEAWIAETSRLKGGFRGNLMAISNLVQGKTPSTAEDTRLAWQSVFLLIPVISSTFASIARLFRYLEPATLGWVLIDEAGQATPQAAVGSIWRAQRVVSIGDPFQIEPITTIPPEIIDGMAKKKINDRTLQWAPSQVSVQNLMDRVSLFGLMRETQEEAWLGSPLRVHRRCLDPMFTIANTIAYDGSMLLATDAVIETSLPPSCWWDVGGEVSNKQYVENQGEALIDLLIDCFIKMKSTDIYVISPFREIVTEIQSRLLSDQTLKKLFEKEFPFYPLLKWIREGIGTVHTFQGKQAATVFFVLGADKTTYRAIDWASKKPNLLNVAITRAQTRFYIIGDYDLWAQWPHFDVAAQKLPRLKWHRTTDHLAS